nr:AbrB/MazE/SpoVT family DNA-binding domain-containing protein [Bacillus pumilus]
MKRTGMVRHIDSLGRIVLPSEMRKVLNIKEEQTVRNFH